MVFCCKIERFCKCEMPYNPDDLMIQCEECEDWYVDLCFHLVFPYPKLSFVWTNLG